MSGWPFCGESLRAMYSHGRADATARRLARFWAAAFALGVLPRRWVTLEVAGRNSGRNLRFPLGMADLDGQWYLVAMLGEHCNWVQNVRAAAGQVTLRRRRAVPCRLAEVPAASARQSLVSVSEPRFAALICAPPARRSAGHPRPAGKAAARRRAWKARRGRERRQLGCGGPRAGSGF